ncbi:hypothetical protein BFJ63_vAg18557 [Fusarium oxysporum f. sp. narcissi]|uniref:Uncharacterized protein n=1 Tax=Fusarium oxysporum f. sp. narcissi TaxID=451672 RepID=A0A4Q2UW61_FUSOX|nr:hypothetical protein BFJ63_vAg18557 [Fusarium oxysporum f. sp. narcissi]
MFPGAIPIIFAATCITSTVASISNCQGAFYAGVCQDVFSPGAHHDGLTRSCCQPPHGTTYDDGPGVFCCTTSSSASISYLSSCCSDSGQRDINFNPVNVNAS